MKRKIIYIIGGFVVICVLLLYLNRLDCIYKIYDYGNHNVYFCIQKIQEDRRSVFEKLPVYEIHLDSLVNFESAPSAYLYFDAMLFRKDSLGNWYEVSKESSESSFGVLSYMEKGYRVSAFHFRDSTAEDRVHVRKTEEFIRNELLKD